MKSNINQTSLNMALDTSEWKAFLSTEHSLLVSLFPLQSQMHLKMCVLEDGHPQKQHEGVVRGLQQARGIG